VTVVKPEITVTVGDETVGALHQSFTSTFQSDFIGELVNATKTLGVIDTVVLNGSDTISSVTWSLVDSGSGYATFRTSVTTSINGQITSIELKSGTKSYASATITGPNVKSGWKIVIDVKVSWSESASVGPGGSITGVGDWMLQSLQEIFGTATRTGIWFSAAAAYQLVNDTPTKIADMSISRSNPASDTAEYVFSTTTGGSINYIEITTYNGKKIDINFTSAQEFVSGLTNKVVFDVKLSV